MLGSRLTSLLQQRKHEVVHLSRSSGDDGSKVKTFQWDVHRQQMDEAALQGVQAIIHLAGAGVVDKPWTERRKQEIVESRTKSTQLLHSNLKRVHHSVDTFISASGIGYYPLNTSDELYTEDSPQGKSFLSDVVKVWESEVDKLQELGLRIVKFRIGVVLSEKGGALTSMMKPVQWYAGAPLGTGKQFVSWIHIDDLCAMMIRAIEDPQLKGVYNGVAPFPVTNKELTQSIARHIHRPLLLPAVPSWVLNFLLGEMAGMVLLGNKVSGEKIMKTGFQFKYPNLENALSDLLDKK